MSRWPRDENPINCTGELGSAGSSATVPGEATLATWTAPARASRSAVAPLPLMLTSPPTTARVLPSAAIRPWRLVVPWIVILAGARETNPNAAGGAAVTKHFSGVIASNPPGSPGEIYPAKVTATAPSVLTVLRVSPAKR
jgi:hypothetical protein